MSNVDITCIVRRDTAWQSANVSQIGAESGPDVARFWSRTQVVGSCWEWTLSRSGQDGRKYGQLSWRGRKRSAHRVAWELANGPIPAGRHVLHHCDNPPCVNPSHLFLGDHDANMKDASQKGRLNTPRPTRQKLSDAQVSQIRSLARSGVMQARLAEQFGVTKGFISHLVKGIRRHVQGSRGVAA
jgi:predicted XRE-type DNA-binding protein